jgi:hypothetical protein
MKCCRKRGGGTGREGCGKKNMGEVKKEEEEMANEENKKKRKRMRS